MKKKILILTASPRRDILIDEMIATKLEELGNEAKVSPCLRTGRDIAIEFQPDVIVVPPIRNMYSRDFCEEAKRYGCGVVSRHTEPSCDWPDFKAMTGKQKAEICGHLPYFVDMELVWSDDEAQILNKRGVRFPVVPVGSFGVDKYLNQVFVKRFRNKAKFRKKHKFNKQKTILVQSPWGFADHAPDLRIEEVYEFKRDIEGRDRHLDMVEKLHEALNNDFNVIITTHPGVITEPYTERLKKLGIPLDTESTSMELMVNSDILIHAGSTMAIGAHFLKMPAFQFGDVNLKDSDNWWHQSGKIMAELSPNAKTAEGLIKLIRSTNYKSNIDKDALSKLEKGRYGKMDGRATERAADLINKVNGKFKFKWPRSWRDYSQLTLQRHPSYIVHEAFCAICKEKFAPVKKEWLDMLKVAISEVLDEEQVNKVMKRIGPQRGTYCPWCGSKFMPPE